MTLLAIDMFFFLAEVPKTPVMGKPFNGYNDGTHLTPHRIELCAENGVKEENKTKKDIPKTKKKLVV